MQSTAHFLKKNENLASIITINENYERWRGRGWPKKGQNAELEQKDKAAFRNLCDIGGFFRLLHFFACVELHLLLSRGVALMRNWMLIRGQSHMQNSDFRTQRWTRIFLQCLLLPAHSTCKCFSAGRRESEHLLSTNRVFYRSISVRSSPKWCAHYLLSVSFDSRCHYWHRGHEYQCVHSVERWVG